MDTSTSRSLTENPNGFGRTVRGVLRKFSPSRGAAPQTNKHGPSVAEVTKGQIGLNLLHSPPDPQIDFIFVHGLGGGSRKTWSSSSDFQHYWPKAWLPQESEFASVRIHSFGYNADWDEWKKSTLTLLDFARSLLGEICYNRSIFKSNTRIVLIGHSMGGIVIKKAYMLAREGPEDSDRKRLASRIHTLYFLATPHQGSGLSKIFANIISVSYGQKTFIAELSRNSESIALINDSFTQCAESLQLWSFYETIPSNLFVTHAIIVDKTSATLGFRNEEPYPLNADHRGVCKFHDQTDSNYQTIRNAFSATIDRIQLDNLRNSTQAQTLRQDRLAQLTGLSEPPDDELLAMQDIRYPGTCQWFLETKIYKSWQEETSSNMPFLWLFANAGFGKSVLSGRIIEELQKNSGCSYFFFKHGNSSKSSLAGCLRALAYQMASVSGSILRRLLEFQQSSLIWEKWDEKTLWRKLFLECIFKDSGRKTHFWVIDAVDECQRYQSFFTLLANAPSCLRILFTSRTNLEITQNMTITAKSIKCYQLQESDTSSDFSEFIDSRMEHMPASHGTGREKLKQKILTKASGSFLWLSLVIKRLEEAYSEEEAEEILDEVPTDMNELYAKMLESVLQNHRAVKLARSVFMWALLSLRPLKIDELQSALKLDTNQTVHNLERFFPAISGQLLFVNQKCEAQIIHQTAKAYLLQQSAYSDLSLHKRQCHTRIAWICLTLLSENFSKRQQSQKLKREAGSSTLVPDSNFTDYACQFFSDHLQKSSPEDDQNWALLCKFLDSNLLVWIEYFAEKRWLPSITRIAKSLRAYLKHRVKFLSPISPQKASMETCIYDLLRLSVKFGRSLHTSPASIHNLIPAICPSESIFSKYLESRSPNTGFIIKGLTDRFWDDCLARIDYPSHQTSAIGCGYQHSAVALSDGTIHLYFQKSTQAKSTLNHGGRANILVFSSEDQFLASSGQRMVKIWNPAEGVQLWALDTAYQTLALIFLVEESSLVAATQGNFTIKWDLQDGQETGRWQWTDCIRRASTAQRSWQQPSKALFSQDYTTLAVSYRGLPLYVFDISTQTLLGNFSRETVSTQIAAPNYYMVDSLAFNPSPEINILVASYGDGELAVYDVQSTRLLYRRPDIFAHCLKCSPNGRTLITGSSRGALQIFEFGGAKGERLLPLYRINAHEDGIREIAFSSDSLRFADIRGSQYRIWEPAVLLCNDLDEGSQSGQSRTPSVEFKSVSMLEGLPESEITTMCCPSNGYFVICGKSDGSVTYFERSTAAPKNILYRHSANVGITCILYIEKSSLLVTGDESGRVVINSILVSKTSCEFLNAVAEIRSEESISALIHDNSGMRLLLRGSRSIGVWTTEGQKIKIAIPFNRKDDDEDDERLFTNHPSKPDRFLSIGRRNIIMFSWTNALEVESCLGDDKPRVNLMLTPPTPTFQSDRCAEAVSDSYTDEFSAPFLAHLPAKNRARASSGFNTLRIWPASSISDSNPSPPSIPLYSFADQSHRIRQIISLAGSLLFFLDVDLWICSLDIKTASTISNGAKRHFFLLSEWQSIDGNFLMNYVPETHEFIVAKNHEVLIVGRGLEFEEPWI